MEAEPSAPLEDLPQLPDHYFEIYSLAVEMADRLSARRVLANSFFATVNTAIIALIGSKDFPWYVSAAGIVLCAVWWALLKSYRDLNGAKFQVINEMEKRLPAKIFTEEWAQLKEEEEASGWKPRHMRQWLAQYRELGAVERTVPFLFAFIYVVDIIVYAGISISARLCWQ